MSASAAPVAPTVVPGSKPTSIKVEPWTDFPRQSYSIHGDDFCHSKPLVAKFAAKGSRSTLNIKQTVVKGKDGKLNVEDEVKLWFDLPNQHSLYTKVKSTNYLKVHYDHGLCSCSGKQWNLYASFWTNKTLTHSSFRVGAGSYHPKCNSDNRVRVDIKSGGHQLHWYNRTLSTFNQFKLGLVSVVDLSNKVLQKNNILLAYNINNNNEAFLRFENKDFRGSNPNWTDVASLWDTVTLNYVTKLENKTRLGFEGAWNLKDKKLQNVEAVIEGTLKQHGVTIKAKANHKQDIAFVVKRALWGLEDLATFSLGLGVSQAFSDKRSFKHGAQFDFNI